LFRHCEVIFKEMQSQSTVRVIDGNAESLVYEGKLVELVTETCGLPVPAYSKATQALKGMGCARQLRRGGGSSGSQWELIMPPTLELFEEYTSQVAPEPEVPEYATQQQVLDLGKRMQTIEKALGL
jgi:hypothetical protein